MHLNRFPAGVYWFTGLSGSGKTTLSLAVAERLAAAGRNCLVLDGDALRAGLCADLGFCAEDRRENIRRAGEMARLAALQNHVCLCAFITPYQDMRAQLRERLGGLYHEIYLRCPIAACMERDPKQNYRKARQGDIQGYTGLDAPYEPPTDPDLCIETARHPVDTCVQTIMEFIMNSK
ncbi:MAG: adenylyl-sulfate kinase [Humidesulfovibrio sp.]|jgi:adenylyl-sulfate kinase|uniref:adenylyl-sulfate kinase n=1 Tax=Humidesulfovibrio sp. TaxID=2910988 RepID=UPI002736BC91|nr:adenylyl-sulfate kinase [Humidesulfovibrio sp.]MDP2848189.1 adenylyl-sulfate kinase [Humidesulfovibrio sp.]